MNASKECRFCHIVLIPILNWHISYVKNKNYVCKKCGNKQTRECQRSTTSANPIIVKEKKKLRYMLQKEQRNKLKTIYRKTHKEIIRAEAAANRAFKKGIITKKSCEKCGNEETVMHHRDYALPLSVMWLCIPCHVREHHWIREEK